MRKSVGAANKDVRAPRGRFMEMVYLSGRICEEILGVVVFNRWPQSEAWCAHVGLVSFRQALATILIA
jgi:hypothetical protein